MNRVGNTIRDTFYQRSQNITYKSAWQRIHLDPLLLLQLCLLAGIGIVILASAATKNPDILMRQVIRLLLAFSLMFVFAQVPPNKYEKMTPSIYILGIVLLVAVLVVGIVGKGAQRWLDLGIIRFQPSEILKLAMPMIIARYLGNRQLPPKFFHVCIAAIMILIPGALIAKQPDLGTALMVMISGACVILAAGLRWRVILSLLGTVAVIAPFMWHHMHDYQRQRLLTFINPEHDPLGNGYHIIQSKIAIGSGGVFGKGWLHGSQSHLHFLPEHTTDFIFAVAGEEFGLFGGIALILCFVMVTARCLFIASQAQDNYSRLLASGLSLTFFLSVFVNMGMVTGLLPVVGLPLPMISYGGTSMVTMMAGFGIIMSIHTHRKFIS